MRYASYWNALLYDRDLLDRDPLDRAPSLPQPLPPPMCGKEQAVCILLECMNYLGCILDKVWITSENFGCISDAFWMVFRKKVTWYECCNMIRSEFFASPPDGGVSVYGETTWEVTCQSSEIQEIVFILSVTTESPKESHSVWWIFT